MVAPNTTSVPALQARHFVFLLLAQLALGSGGLFGRLALAGSSPAAVAALRMVFVALPLIARHLLLRRPLWGRAIEARLVIAAALLSIQLFLWAQTLSRLSVAATTLLICCTPLWNGLFDVFVRRRRLPAAFWLAMTIAMAGVALLVTGHAPSQVSVPEQTGLGVMLGAACGLAAASYLLLIRRIALMRYADKSPPMLDIVTRTYVMAAVALTSVTLALKQPLPSLQAVNTWAGILGTAVISQGVGHTLLNVSLKRLPARIVSFATLAEPLIATVAAAVVFGEPITASSMVGGALILLGVAWAMRVSE